jgi:hypothetical protein
VSWTNRYTCDTCGKEHETDGDAGWLEGWYTVVLANDTTGVAQKRWHFCTSECLTSYLGGFKA